MRVNIVGAGFSGLSAAFYLRRAGCEVIVHEREKRVGGMISTLALRHSLVETAANAVLNSGRFTELARELGLDLLGTGREANARYLFRGQPRRWPLGFRETARATLGIGKLLLGLAPERPGETLASWAERTLGKAAQEFLLAPAIQGIYAAPPDRLSAALVLGSMRVRKRERKGAWPRGSVAPQKGMGELMRALGAKLRADGVEFASAGSVTAQSLASGGKWVVATGLADAAPLLVPTHPGVAAALAGLPRLPIASVTLVFEKSAIQFPGFGCLFPRSEGFRALGVLSNTHIFPGRTDKHSETWIFSGETESRAAAGSESELVQLALADRRRLHGRDDALVEASATSWPQGIPLYGLSLERFLASGAIKELERDGIFLHGNYLGRLGLAGILELSASLPARMGA